MNTNYNIQDLLKQAFNIGSNIAFLDLGSVMKAKAQNYEFADNELKPVEPSSFLNTPILMPMEFVSARKQVYENGNIVEKSFSGMVIPPASVVDFSQAIKREKSEVSGRNGSVKETHGLDDWRIRIRGVAVNEIDFRSKPQEFINALVELKNYPGNLEMVNEMCKWLGIYEVVVDNVELPAMEGYPGTQPFVIELSSDMPFEIKFKDGI
jgi:hypothetical protein